MTRVRLFVSRIARKIALTPEQAEQLARLKFPCC